MLGELKIPGYSAYLHPVGEDLLLGVGQDATEEGRPTGTQLSLFDVSNLRSPTRLHTEHLGLGWSEAESDHHAFLYWPRTGLVVIPFEQRAVGYRVGRTRGIDAGRPHRPRGGEAELHAGRPPLDGRPRLCADGLGRGRQVELAGDAGRARLGRVPAGRSAEARCRSPAGYAQTGAGLANLVHVLKPTPSARVRATRSALAFRFVRRPSDEQSRARVARHPEPLSAPAEQTAISQRHDVLRRVGANTSNSGQAWPLLRGRQATVRGGGHNELRSGLR